MTTLTVTDIPLDASAPAQRLRRVAAAVRVHFTWWGVHRTLTPQQKEEIGDTCGADARLLSAGKRIVDVRHKAFRKLSSIRSRTVSYWRGSTLPYVEPGVRLIKQSDIDGFVHTLEDARVELVQAESELNSVYDEIKSDAQRRLGQLYNPADYPAEIRNLFTLDWDFPATEPPSYLLRLNPELYQQEQERVARRFEEAVGLAEQAFATEFAQLLAHLTERLGHGEEGQRRVFRDSVVTNLSDFFERFRHLNVRSNPELDQLVEQAQTLVRGVQPQALRDNTRLRQEVATQMAAVQTQLDGLLIDRPRRQLIRSQPVRNGDGNGVAH